MPGFRHNDTGELMLLLRRVCIKDLDEIRDAYDRSKNLHYPWTSAPQDFHRYLEQEGRYFVCLQSTGEIVGTFNISNIVRGYFQSAYLGYEVFMPHQGKGYMAEGLTLLLSEAFGTLNLHRLEANIQPENTASIALVARRGFVKEGFSRQYLRVGGAQWQDHERWAIINENWIE